MVQVKALACELPHRLGLPLWWLSLADIRQEGRTQGIVAQMSGTTLWRWLSADALRPWQHRSWIFPRGSRFASKAGRILDLYARLWHGEPLQSAEFVLPADEKTSVQARRRKPLTWPPAAVRPTRVEHEYFREGAWTYLAAWDVDRARLFCELTVSAWPLRTPRRIDEAESRASWFFYHADIPVLRIEFQNLAHKLSLIEPFSMLFKEGELWNKRKAMRKFAAPERTLSSAGSKVARGRHIP